MNSDTFYIQQLLYLYIHGTDFFLWASDTYSFIVNTSKHMVYRCCKSSKSSCAWAISLTKLFSSRVLWLSEWHLVAQVWHLGVIHDTSHIHIPTSSQSPNPLDSSSCKSLSPSTSAQGEGHSPPDYQICPRCLTSAGSLGVLRATLTSDI